MTAGSRADRQEGVRAHLAPAPERVRRASRRASILTGVIGEWELGRLGRSRGRGARLSGQPGPDFFEKAREAGLAMAEDHPGALGCALVRVCITCVAPRFLAFFAYMATEYFQ